MKLWLRKVFEEAEKEYEELPDWKKKLWDKKDFLKETSSIREKTVKYDNSDWT